MRINRQTALDKAAGIGGWLVALGIYLLALKSMQTLLEWLGLSEQAAFWVSWTAYFATFIGLMWLLQRRMRRRSD